MTLSNKPTTPLESFPHENNLANIEGFVRTMSSAPTYIPKKFSEQIVVAVAGGLMTLYVYDTVNNLWRQAALT